MKTPSYYVAPLKSRADIVAFLKERVESNPGSHHGLFCYDVKLHNLNTDFDHAVKLAKEGGYLPSESARYLAECRELWDEKMETAFEVGAEDACRDVVEEDTYRMLWDGDKPIADWEFAGRSGGWLVLKSFRHVDFKKHAGYECLTQRDYFIQLLEEASYDFLRDLYRFLIQCDHDFRRPESEVEYLASSWFFLNAVDGIQTDKEVAEIEAKRAKESEERAYWESREVVTV